MNTQKMRIVALALAMGLSGAVQAAATYSVTNLGTLGNGSSYATGINNSGQVIGYFDVGGGYSQAFLYSGGGMTDLGTLGGSGSYATGINDSGQVVGTSGTDGFFRAFLYSGGVMTQVSDSGGVSSNATGINDSGQIVGASMDNQITLAFLNNGGVVTTLGNWNSTSSNARDINNNGQIVGSSSVLDFSNGYYPPSFGNSRAFLYSGGITTDLGTLGGAYSQATGINDSGQIVGISDGHAFLYSNGSMADLGALTGTSSVGDINNNGQVVGASGGHAFLYSPSDGVRTDLNSLVDPLSGWTITDATDINDSGQIAANGCNATGCFALLLAPVPEPETYAMLLAGLGLVSFAVRRRASVK